MAQELQTPAVPWNGSSLRSAYFAWGAALIGVLMAAMTAGQGRRVRHVQVPFEQPVIEIDFPATVRRLEVAAALEVLLDRVGPDAVAETARQLGYADIAGVADSGDVGRTRQALVRFRSEG